MAKDRNPLAYTGRIQSRTDLYGDGFRPISGTATLITGIATVPLRVLKSNSVIVLSKEITNGSTAVGVPFITSSTPGVGFTITAFSAIAVQEVPDVSDISWLVFTPEVD